MVTGRPRALTPQRMQNIIKIVEKGNFKSVAAASAGICYGTLKKWQAIGSAEIDRIENGEEPRPDLAAIVDFVAKLKSAETKAEMACVAIILKNARKTWQSAAWYLERKHPDRWGAKERKEKDEVKPGLRVVSLKSEQQEPVQ